MQKKDTKQITKPILTGGKLKPAKEKLPPGSPPKKTVDFIRKNIKKMAAH